jgi:pSer/pThr/pTyr-binding forkhead associated (FHA) protein
VDTDTVINHKVVSGLQCMIWREWDPDAPGDPSLAVVYLEDFSTNGTYVNTVKVKNEKIAIGDGDDISLGQAVEGRELTSEFRESSTFPEPMPFHIN